MTQKTKTKEKPVQATDQKQLYGLYVMIHPSSDEPSVQKLHTEICGIVKEKQGDIQESKECTKQELSFPIQKALHAYTATIYFTADPENAVSIRESVKMVDGPLLRYILTKETHIPSAESAFEMPEDKKPDAPKDQQPTTSPQDQSTPTTQQQQKSKITIEDIDKKLDEIMGNV